MLNFLSELENRIKNLTILLSLIIITGSPRCCNYLQCIEAKSIQLQFLKELIADTFDITNLNNNDDYYDYEYSEFDGDPETTPNLYQGDIAIDPKLSNMLRIGINPIRFSQRIWPNGTIPFAISTDYEIEERFAILRAFRILNSLTCVKFVPIRSNDSDYILLQPPSELVPRGCWSFVGRTGGQQVVTLQPPDDKSRHCFSSEGRIIHELMHVIGIYHEQSRADRDKYVKIHWDNIMPKYKKNFKRVSESKGTYTYPYDYNSVMHYGLFYFSKEKGKLPSITPIEKNIKIGQRRTLSKMDCLKINELYGCLKGRQAKKFQSFCNLLGL